jgi:molybdopterin-containing oxidoreductase family iron-sulfur binding subunit
MSGAPEVPEVRIDLSEVRRRANGATGRHYWKSLEELAVTPGFQDFLHREFPENASEWNDPEGRRDFLRVMGASIALAGLTACTRQPTEKIVPYVKAPEEMVPGRPLFFATAVTDGGYAKGILVESHEGRPTKIEGNPDHPASLGASDSTTQAAILGLYDPDRSQTVKNLGEIRSWGAFVAAARAALTAQKALSGTGFRLLTETVTSPTLAAQIRALLAEYPQARWHQYEPTAPDNARAGAQMAFGAPVEASWRLANADVILSLECDFLASGPGSVRLTREFAQRRKPEAGAAKMNRLYVVEGTPSLTGAAADHRLPVRSSEIEGLARAVAAAAGVAVSGGAAGPHGAFVASLAKDLQRAGSRALVVAGESQPPAVHAIAHAINAHLGAIGTTVAFTAPIVAEPAGQTESLRALARDMAAGKVDLLLILGGNPVYDAPVDVGFTAALDRVALRVHAGLYEDETAERCQWHVAMAHPLESWGDARAEGGIATIQQPLIAPLYGGKSVHEVLAAFSAQPERSGYDIVREHWKGALGESSFEQRWLRAVHDGVVAGTEAPPVAVAVGAGAWAAASPAPVRNGLEIVFRADGTVGDGRHANSGWLQELPRPLTKLTWDNAVLMSPRTAERLGVGVGATAGGTENTSAGSPADVVEVRYGGRNVRGPAWVLPGQPDDVVTVHLGFGRTRAGRVGNGVGFDAYALRTADAPWFGLGADVVKTGEQVYLACTQDHWSMEGRAPVRSVSIGELERDHHAIAEMGEKPPVELNMYPGYKYEGHAWGMAIDLSSCVGCNACTTACQAENNIPVVGKDQVARGREMHWIRVDRYFEGGVDNPSVHHQPIPCMHCEQAPCEVVCPVAATVHSDEGLNDMVYNRCVGTRYCSNNCPYKVRRFNFYLYQDFDTPSLKLLRNPDVTVRSRGVMEKCTYCVQRIQRVKIDAKNQKRSIRDGEITPACAQACPAQAIVFGDVNDPQSAVSKLKALPRNYGVLEELNTRPRTTYLGQVKNPNPELSRG